MKIKLGWHSRHEFHSQRGGPYLALAALALSAAGTGVSMAASKQEQDKMNERATQEMQRQKGFQKQATGEFEKSLGQSGVERAKADTSKGSQILQDQYAKTASLPTGAESASASLPTSQVSEERAGAQNQAARVSQANLGGISEWDINQWIKNLRAQQQLGHIANFARGSANVMPWEIQAASNSRAGEHALGTGLGLAGSLLGLYGAGAAGLGAQAGSVAPTVLSSEGGAPSADWSGWGKGAYFATPRKAAPVQDNSNVVFPF